MEHGQPWECHLKVTMITAVTNDTDEAPRKRARIP